MGVRAMSNKTNRQQELEKRVGRNEVLTDEEYEYLLKQKELEELHSLNGSERRKAESDKQVTTFIFLLGMLMGAILLSLTFQILVWLFGVKIIW